MCGSTDCPSKTWAFVSSPWTIGTASVIAVILFSQRYKMQTYFTTSEPLETAESDAKAAVDAIKDFGKKATGKDNK